MFLVAGTKARRTVIDSGKFTCPQEKAVRRYEHVRQKRSVTVFFLPVSDAGTLGEYVECLSCGATYSVELLTHQGTEQAMSRADAVPWYSRNAPLFRAIQRLAVATAAVDGAPDSDERKAVFELLSDHYGFRYKKRHFERDLKASTGEDLEALLTSAATELNKEGRVALLGTAVMLALIDDEISEAELSLIRRAGIAIGVPRRKVDRLIDKAVKVLAELTDKTDPETAERNAINRRRAAASRAAAKKMAKEGETQLFKDMTKESVAAATRDAAGSAARAAGRRSRDVGAQLRRRRSGD